MLYVGLAAPDTHFRLAQKHGTAFAPAAVVMGYERGEPSAKLASTPGDREITHTLRLDIEARQEWRGECPECVRVRGPKTAMTHGREDWSTCTEL